MEEEEAGDVDESGVEAKDVELVMTQVEPPLPSGCPNSGLPYTSLRLS